MVDKAALNDPVKLAMFRAILKNVEFKVCNISTGDHRVIDEKLNVFNTSVRVAALKFSDRLRPCRGSCGFPRPR